MKIGVDARPLEWVRGGVARYLANVLRHWAAMAPQNRYYLFFQHHLPSDEFLGESCFRLELVKAPGLLDRRSAWELFVLPRHLRGKGLDLFFSAYYTQPPWTHTRRRVVGVWDISYAVHPEWYSLKERLALAWPSRLACRRADAVLTCSNFDKGEIARHFRVPPERITVTPLAPEEKFKPLENRTEIQAVKAKYGLPERFVLFLGVVLNRRNLPEIIRGLRQVHERHPEVGLVLAGRNRTRPFVDIDGILDKLNLGGMARRVDFLPEEDIVPMYNAASAFIYTSLYEGEGIPLKEALACGVPVITSPLLREAVGDAGYIVEDPRDPAQIAQAMEAVLFDQGLRQGMVERGLTWIKGFSWERCAREALEVFQRVCDEPTHG